MRFRLSHFDPLGPLDAFPTSEICSDASISASMEGTRQSAALIKNIDNALPLDATALSNVAVIGPNIDLSKTMSSYYGSSEVCKGQASRAGGGGMYTIVDAVQAQADLAGNFTVATAKGVTDPKAGADPSMISEAANVASAADAVVMALGTDLQWAREGHDGTSIALSDGQLALVEAVTNAAKAPVTVVMMTATPLDLSPLLSNPRVGAILHVGAPSVTVLAAGDLLFGRSSPAGRTIQTVYPASYADDVSIFDFNMRPGPSDYPAPSCTTQPQSSCPNATNPGRTYRFYTGEAVVPFGFGLSYSTFEYETLAVDHLTKKPLSSSSSDLPHTVSLAPVNDLVDRTRAANRSFFEVAQLESAAGSVVSYEVRVTNTGKVDADDAVLGFITPPGAGQNGVPLKQLFGFGRVHVKAGQTVSVYLYPALSEFTQVGEDGTRRVHAGDYEVSFGEERSGQQGQGYATSMLRTTK